MTAPSALYATVLARLKAIEPTASFNVTRRVLSLGAAHATTGIYAKSFTPATIEALIVTKGTQRHILGLGYNVKHDALMFTDTAVADGDEIQSGTLYYNVVGVQPVPFGDVNVCYVADLALMPLHE